MAAGRTRRQDEERRRRLQLSRFTPTLTQRILTMDGTRPLQDDIPIEMVTALEKGSLRDRLGYSQEQAKGKNFGVQMVQWLSSEDGATGIVPWISRQKDVGVIRMLQAIGLQPSNEEIQTGLHEPPVIALVRIINADLARTGYESIPDNELRTSEVAGPLIFYSTYLSQASTEEGGDKTKNIINTLVKAATDEAGGDPAATLENLQKLSPLFAVAGLNAQHALGALAVAKLHAAKEPEKVAAVPADATLSTEEKAVLDFLKAVHEAPEQTGEYPTPLIARYAYNVVDVFTKLKPAAMPKSNSYWVQEVPDTFASDLTPGQVTSLENAKNFFTPDGSASLEVFDPRTLVTDTRFRNAEVLTNRDSGIFALAAASAPTPEVQAKVYQALGETILRAHKDNPQLLKTFLGAQTPQSLRHFAENDYDRVQSGSPEDTSVFTDFSKYPDRLVAITLEMPEQGNEVVLENVLVPHVDPEATVAGWSTRVAALSDVLGQPELILTPEQISQIEFLGHSMDVMQAMNLLQGRARRTGPDQAAA